MISDYWLSLDKPEPLKLPRSRRSIKSDPDRQPIFIWLPEMEAAFAVLRQYQPSFTKNQISIAAAAAAKVAPSKNITAQSIQDWLKDEDTGFKKELAIRRTRYLRAQMNTIPGRDNDFAGELIQSAMELTRVESKKAFIARMEKQVAKQAARHYEYRERQGRIKPAVHLWYLAALRGSSIADIQRFDHEARGISAQGVLKAIRRHCESAGLRKPNFRRGRPQSKKKTRK